MNLILILLLTLFIQDKPCNCEQYKTLEQAQKASYEKNNMIFIAELEDIEDSLSDYSLRVIEVLKGDYSNNIIKGKYIDNCSYRFWESPYPWIIYGNINSKNEIEVFVCSLTRYFGSPYFSNYDYPLPPPPPNDNIDMLLDWEIGTVDYQKKALNILTDEINHLRKLRDKK